VRERATSNEFNLGFGRRPPRQCPPTLALGAFGRFLEDEEMKHNPLRPNLFFPQNEILRTTPVLRLLNKAEIEEVSTETFLPTIKSTNLMKRDSPN
jgi:hypothetical protein